MPKSNSTDVVTFRPVPNFDGYWASSDGHVWSCRSPGHGGRPHMMKPWLCGGPRGHYPLIAFSVNGKRYRRLVHRVILHTFTGSCPDEMECRHIDGDGFNNRVENLQWGTKKQNGQDKIRHGRSNRGELTHTAKLTDSIVIHIRQLAQASHVNYAALARQYHVKRSAIRMAVLGKTWKHIT